MKKIILFVTLFFIGLQNTNALFCDYTELATIRKKASQVNITSDFEELEDSVTYTITIYNLQPSQYVVDTTTGKRYMYGNTGSEDSSEIVLTDIQKPGMYKFLVYSTENTCNDDALNTLFVNLPTYNKYYKDPLCEGIENYKLCQRWFGTSITYAQFQKDIADYKTYLNNRPKEEEEKTFWENLLSLYIESYYIFLPILILLLCVPIYIIYEKKYKVDF